MRTGAQRKGGKGSTEGPASATDCQRGSNLSSRKAGVKGSQFSKQRRIEEGEWDASGKEAVNSRTYIKIEQRRAKRLDPERGNQRRIGSRCFLERSNKRQGVKLMRAEVDSSRKVGEKPQKRRCILNVELERHFLNLEEKGCQKGGSKRV